MAKYLVCFFSIPCALLGMLLVIFKIENYQTWIAALMNSRNQEMNALSDLSLFKFSLAVGLIALLGLVYILVLRIREQPKKPAKMGPIKFFILLVFILFTLSFNTFNPNGITCLIRSTFSKIESVPASVTQKEYSFRGRGSLNGKYFIYIETIGSLKDRIPVTSEFYEKVKVGDSVSALSCGILASDFFIKEDRRLWDVAHSMLSYFMFWLLVAYLAFACIVMFWIHERQAKAVSVS